METGLSIKGKVTRVIDGDTIEVTITRKVNVRIKGLMTPELKAGGKPAKEFLENTIAEKSVVIFIPANNDEHFLDFNSFNRVVGDVYLEDKSIANLMVENGYGKFGNKQG